MKSLAASLVVLLGLLFSGAGCQQLDLTPEGNPARVVAGVVNLRPDILFPPDTEVVVRMIDNTPVEKTATTAGADTPADRIRPGAAERVLGEQVIRAPAGKPVPFRIEFAAADAQLRRGLNLDVRISYHGRVQFRTLNAHVVTLSSVQYPQEVWVETAR